MGVVMNQAGQIGGPCTVSKRFLKKIDQPACWMNVCPCTCHNEGAWSVACHCCCEHANPETGSEK